jgi:hypothetical protein
MCFGDILLCNILPHRRNKMIKSFLHRLCHSIIRTYFRRRQCFPGGCLRETWNVSRCRTTGQKGMPSCSINVIYFHSIIQFNIPLESNDKPRMPFLLRASIGSRCRFSFSFRFTSINFYNGIFNHGKKFPFLILFSFSRFFFASGFFMKDFRHGSFVMELISLMSSSFHASFKTMDKKVIYTISNLLQIITLASFLEDTGRKVTFKRSSSALRSSEVRFVQYSWYFSC